MKNKQYIQRTSSYNGKKMLVTKLFIMHLAAVALFTASTTANAVRASAQARVTGQVAEFLYVATNHCTFKIDPYEKIQACSATATVTGNVGYTIFAQVDAASVTTGNLVKLSHNHAGGGGVGVVGISLDVNLDMYRASSIGMAAAGPLRITGLAGIDTAGVNFDDVTLVAAGDGATAMSANASAVSSSGLSYGTILINKDNMVELSRRGVVYNMNVVYPANALPVGDYIADVTFIAESKP